MTTPDEHRREHITAAANAATYTIHDTRTLGKPLSDVEIASIAIDTAYDLLRRAFAEEIATAIEAYQVEAHMPVCPPAIAWEAGRERAAQIARSYGKES